MQTGEYAEERVVTEAATSRERPQPVSPGPGSTEACQQKINKLGVGMFGCLREEGGTRKQGVGVGGRVNTHTRGQDWFDPAMIFNAFIL